MDKTFEFIQKRKDEEFALRVIEHPEEEDVVLAYISSDKINSDENIVLNNHEDIQSEIQKEEIEDRMAVSDSTGKLFYAEKEEERGYFIKSFPYDEIKEREVYITNRFENQEWEVEQAFYYVFEFEHHYEKTKGKINEWSKYEGKEIFLLNQYGDLISESQYDIYIKKRSENTNIQSVKIYLKEKSDEEKTFYSIYNHIENVLPENEIGFSSSNADFYSDFTNDNICYLNSKRIINAISCFKKEIKSNVVSASESEEKYSIDVNPDKSAYEVYVPQKEEMDPREKKIFHYKVDAIFKQNGKLKTVTFGYVSDELLHEDTLLEFEEKEYENGFKKIGLKQNGKFLNAEEMIKRVVYNENIPATADYVIYDTSGNILYTGQLYSEDSNIHSVCDIDGLKEMKSKKLTTNMEWEKEKNNFYQFQSIPINHKFTVFAERNAKEIDFAFRVDGEGDIFKDIPEEDEWRLKQKAYFKWKQAFNFREGFEKWFTIPATKVIKNNIRVDSKSNTVIKYLKGKEAITLTRNLTDLEAIINDGKDYVNKKNYIFSVDVVVDTIADDDMIGIIFRSQYDSTGKFGKNFYMFCWERELNYNRAYWEKNKKTNSDFNSGVLPARMIIGEGGISHISLNYGAAKVPQPHPTGFVDPSGYWAYPHDASYFDDYLKNQYTFRDKKKRIFKAGYLKAGVKRLPKYKKDLGYKDITNLSSPNYRKMGWVPNKKYRITAEIIDNDFKIYIKEINSKIDYDSPEKGILVCEASDPAPEYKRYNKGSFGMFTISQSKANWSNINVTELIKKEVYSPYYDSALTKLTYERLSTPKGVQKADAIMSGIMEKELEKMKASQKVNFQLVSKDKIEAESRSKIMDVKIDGEGFPVGKLKSGTAVKKKHIRWRTKDEKMSVFGTGRAYLKENGEVITEIFPSEIKIDLPKEVKNFKWTEVRESTSTGASLKLHDFNKIKASFPPMSTEEIGTPITFEGIIEKSEGIKELVNVIEQELLEKLQIPENISYRDVTLRIERGDELGNNKEFRVNYRFAHKKNEKYKFELDQEKNGANRMKAISILKEKNEINKTYDLKNMLNENEESGNGIFVGNPNMFKKWKFDNNSKRIKFLSSDFALSGFINKETIKEKNYEAEIKIKTIPDSNNLPNNNGIGIIFKAIDEKNFYMLLIEGENKYGKVGTGSGTIRKRFGEFLGVNLSYDIEDYYEHLFVSSSAYINNALKFEQEYVKSAGWKLKNRKLFRIENGIIKLIPNQKAINSLYSGWVYGKEHSIKVKNEGKKVRLYFDNNYCFELDTAYENGGYGFVSFGQAVEIINSKAKIKNNEISQTAKTDIVGWTNCEIIKAVPIFAIRHGNDEKIIALKPRIDEESQTIRPWHINIRHGIESKKFSLPEKTYNYNDAIYKNCPELLSYAPFSPANPTEEIDYVEAVFNYETKDYYNLPFLQDKNVHIEKEQAEFINKSTIRVKNKPIFVGKNKEETSLTVYKLKQNVNINLEVKDIDSHKGLIYLKKPIKEKDRIYVSYVYISNEFEYRGFKKNGEFIYLDLNPTVGHEFSIMEKGNLKMIPDIDDVTTYGLKREKSISLFGYEFYIYMKPSSVYVIKNGEKTIVKNYPDNNQTIFHTTEKDYFDKDSVEYNPTYLLIAKVSVRKNIELKDILVEDTRKRGGGVHEKIDEKEIINISENAKYYWDIEKEQYYPKNGVLVIEIEKEKYKKMKEEIEKIVEKYKAVGVYPIVRFYEEEFEDYEE